MGTARHDRLELGLKLRAGGGSLAGNPELTHRWDPVGDRLECSGGLEPGRRRQLLGSGHVEQQHLALLLERLAPPLKTSNLRPLITSGAVDDVGEVAELAGEARQVRASARVSFDRVSQCRG